MKSWSLLAVVAWLQCHVAGTRAVPARTTEGQILLGEVDIAVQGSEFDEITTEQTFPKKCVVNGNAYSHSQTIPSYDANSHCLCVAGEVYCWWQNYSPSTDPSAGGPSLLPSTTIESNYTPSLEESTDADDSSEEAFGDPEQQGYAEINGTYSTTSQPAPTTCLVMGNISLGFQFPTAVSPETFRIAPAICFQSDTHCPHSCIGSSSKFVRGSRSILITSMPTMHLLISDIQDLSTFDTACTVRPITLVHQLPS
nr:uncharacterized protein LOC116426554 isoform X1 [Nomia melanderi]